ncbi:TylF/MycF/NovP-related O-methyltransferase [Pelagibius sp. Alg239-R121]|uniref:TylF/MycF/NovP-related O-methyltransferase n=1 Tax=Pelagibius sp. Alg239-R121 TaxID=2993448 RepID=UPI0024A618D9|nr:TylF/MycF/NovP-related O-methyltransferase [Pelagibius sp. Alg239-R121]
MFSIGKKILGKLTHRDPPKPLPPLASKIKSCNLTYLSADKFISLEKEICRIQQENVAGEFAEFGVALGGSAIYLAHRAEEKRFLGFDVFDMIPPPSERDGEDTHARYEIIKSGESSGIGGDLYYGYEENLYDRVVQNFRDFDLLVDGKKISLEKGLFEDTVKFGASDRISLAHIDCDWYDPVKFCVETVSPVLSRRGVIILDDYNDYGGCREAANEVLASDQSLKLDRHEPHAVIRKI